MLADAIRSEAYRLTRNRMTVFWSVVFVPLMFVVGGLIFNLVTRSNTASLNDVAALPPALSASAPVNLMDGLGLALDQVANGAILVFMLIAAATLYAGDYRWETWRLISARNSRPNQLLGKVAVFALTALAAMILFLVAGMAFGVGEALVHGRSLTIDARGFDAAPAAPALLLGWVRIVQYAMLALLAAVVTRSLLAALFVPLVVGFGQSLMGGPGLAILGWQPEDWSSQLLLPGLAYTTLKAAIGGAPLPDDLTLKAIASLALWLFTPLAAAIAWFSRQDLSKE